MGTALLLFINTTYTNKGRQDNKSIGAAAAVLYYAGKEWGHTARVLGDHVTRSNAKVSAMRPALALLSDFLLSFQYSGPVHFVTGSAEASGLFLNFGHHAMQHFSIEYAHTIDRLLTAYPGLTLSIQHAKHNPNLIGFKCARQLLLEVVKCP
jgi:hypothetical protein